MTDEERLNREIISYGEKYKAAAAEEAKLEEQINAIKLNKFPSSDFAAPLRMSKNSSDTQILEHKLKQIRHSKKSYFDLVEKTQKQLADLENKNTGQNESAPAAPAARATPAVPATSEPPPAPAPTKPIEDFNSAVAAAKEEAQQKIAQSRQQTATSKEDHLARQEAHAMEREAKKEVNQAAGTRAATEGREASKAIRDIAAMGQRQPTLPSSRASTSSSDSGELEKLDREYRVLESQYTQLEKKEKDILREINYKKIDFLGNPKNLSSLDIFDISRLEEKLKQVEEDKNKNLDQGQALQQKRKALSNTTPNLGAAPAAPPATRPAVPSAPAAPRAPIPDVDAMSDAPLSDPQADDRLFEEAKAATGRADPNLVAPSQAGTISTKNSSAMKRFGSLVGQLPPPLQQRVTNPYTQPIARSNPTEVEAIRDAEAREKIAQENATINAFPSAQIPYETKDLDENVDTQAGMRDQLLQLLFQSLKIPYPELPLEQIFADESSTKLKSDQQLMDFLRHQFDLDDVKKMQDYSTGIKNTENEVGNTLRDLVRQDTISEQTNPYLKAGTENITGDALKEFSNPQVQERMDFLRRIALEQFKEAAEERKKEFTSNLHRQFPGHSFFNSARVAAEKKFMDAELRREKDLEDRLLNERFNAEEAERNRAERILSGNRQNNLSGAETASKVASMANVARNSAAQSLMSHAREKRQNHLQGINTIRGLGGEETARTQEKMNAMNAQRAKAAANSRNLPAQLLAMTNEAPYPGLPYDQAPTYVAPPIRSRAGEMYAQTKMNSGAGAPSSGGSDLLNTGVNAASTILQNVLGTRK